MLMNLHTVFSQIYWLLISLQQPLNGVFYNTEAMSGKTYSGWTEALLNKTGEGEILQAYKCIFLKCLHIFSTINLTELYTKEHWIEEFRMQSHLLLPQVLVKWHSTASIISKQLKSSIDYCFNKMQSHKGCPLQQNAVGGFVCY